MLDLFEHPVLDVRLLAARELLARITEAVSTPDQILAMWPGLTSSAQEWCIAVLMALGDSLGLPQVTELCRHVSAVAHYNIRATTATLVERHPAVTDELRSKASALVSNPRLLLPPTSHLEPLLPLWLPRYFEWVANVVDQETGIDLEAAVRAHLTIEYGDPTSGWDHEMQVHRDRNINTNFDTIEISGPYDRAARTAINQALHGAVLTGEIASDKAIELGRHLQLLDPDDLLERPALPPNRSWNSSDSTDASFLAFDDIDQRLAEFAVQDALWLSLHQHSEHRTQVIADRSRRHSLISKVRVVTFLYPTALGEPTLPSVRKEIDGGVLQAQTNRARMALSPNHQLGSRALLISLATVQVRRWFRRRFHLDRAMVNERTWTSIRAGLKADATGAGLTTRSLVWQSEFDQDRRRQEPISSGFDLFASRSSVEAQTSGSSAYPAP